MTQIYKGYESYVFAIYCVCRENIEDIQVFLNRLRKYKKRFDFDQNLYEYGQKVNFI
ncbi:hypothetical protein CUZ56_01488 [Saezia sanguinis]|uniref:Uncharacterized protein n=1 Tax=Saezia sanguinis TaxID=1965230 RepID=A0A433SD74_9BURK|nr:hypothetical protein CUZ56_01488 [Saezia sanguinis]